MSELRIPVKVYKWDKSLRQDCWVSQIKQILQYCDMYECMLKNIPCDLDVLTARLKVLNRNKWWLEANDKPKLRTYVQIHDHDNRRTIVKKNLSRSERSIVTKFKCGVLPIMIETGRYKDVPLEDRLCQICSDHVLEDEEHFIGKCSALSNVRSKYKTRFNELGINIEAMSVECIKNMLHPDCIKLTCELLSELFEERKVLMNNITINEPEEEEE